jgi:glycosyltransferase involved in cell wall biosynthesis
MARVIYDGGALLRKRKRLATTRPEKFIRRQSRSKGKSNNLLFAVTPSGWAYDLRCIHLIEYLKHHYTITKAPISYSVRNSINYDLVYAPGFESVVSIGKRCSNVCTTIGGLVVKSMKEALHILSKTVSVSIVNLGWYEEFESNNRYGIKAFYIPNGVQTGVFTPRSPNTKTRKEFTVGWVGNDSPRRLNVKRIDKLRETCRKLGVTLVEKNWKHNYWTHEKMPDFYRKIDLYVNCSTTEGSNNPILEASSAAVPVLATPVGNVPELISSGVIPLSMDLRDLATKIMYVKEMLPEKRREIGDKLRVKMVNEFDWKIQAEKYRAMFEYSLQVLGHGSITNNYIRGE